MGARKLGEQSIRSLTQNTSGTYTVSLPIQAVKELTWRKGQKVTVVRRGKKLIIEDWQP